MGSVPLTKEDLPNLNEPDIESELAEDQRLDPTRVPAGASVVDKLLGTVNEAVSIYGGFDPGSDRIQRFIDESGDEAVMLGEQLGGEAALTGEGRYDDKLVDRLPFSDSRADRLRQIARNLAQAKPPKGWDTSEAKAKIAGQAIQIEKSGFDPAGAGVFRTYADIAKFIPNVMSGAANAASWGLFNDLWTRDRTYRDKFSKYREDLEKKDIKRFGEEEAQSPANMAIRSFKSIYKLFDESKELPTGAEYAEEMMKQIEGLGLTRAQANELTRFGREGASAQERIIRLLPEMYFFGRATIAWFARGKAKTLKGAQESYDKLNEARKQSSRPISEINEQDFSRVLSDLLENKWKGKKQPTWMLTQYIRRAKQKSYAERVGALVGRERMPELRKEIFPKLIAAEKKLRDLRKMSPKDKSLIKDQVIRVNSLKGDLHRTLPHLYRSAWYTEGMATAGGAAWYQLGGGDSFSWIGFLAGGLTGGMTLKGLDSLTTGVGNVLGRTLFKRVDAIAGLSPAEREELFKRGKLPEDLLPDPDSRKAVEDYVIFVRSLPEAERTRALDQIEYFSELKQKLEANGMDPELLQTTVGRAMNLVPLMILQEQMAALGVDASKGIKGLGHDVAEMIELETFAREQLEMFSKSFRELTGQAEKIGYKGDIKFEELKESLVQLNNNMETTLDASTEEIGNWAEKALMMLKTRLYTNSHEATNDAVEILTKIINHDLYTRTPTDKSSELAWSMGTNIEQVIRQGLAKMQELQKVGDDFWSDLGKLYDINVEQSALDEVHKTIYDLVSEEAIKRSVGSAKIKYLENIAGESGERVQAVLTKWMRSLYAEDSTATTIYDVVLPSAQKSKILMSLSGMRLSNESTLKALTNVSGRESVQSLINPKKSRTAQEFKDHLLEQFEEANFEIDGEPVEVVNYGTIKMFFESLNNTGNLNGGQGLSHFDVFRMVEDYVKFANVQRGADDLVAFVVPEIRLNIADVQRISSGFSTAARETSDNAMKRKYSELSKSIMDSLDDIHISKEDGTVIVNPSESKLIGVLGGTQTLKSMLRDYKDWHLNEIVKRFEDRAGNPLGSRLHDTSPVSPKEKKVKLEKPRKVKGRWVSQRRHRDFTTSPDQWIDLNKIIKAGGAGGDEARSLINQLERTFGDYVPPDITGVEGQYILNEAAKAKVKRVLNVLLKREIGRLPHVQDSQKIISKYTGRRGLGSIKLSEGQALEEGKRLLHDRSMTIDNLLNDNGLRHLENAGLLDLEDLVVHNMSLQKHLGSVHMQKQAIKQIEETVKIDMKSLVATAKSRHAALKNVFKSEGIPEAQKGLEFEAAYDFFVTSPFGPEKANRIVKALVEQGKYDEKTARAILGDYVMEGMSKRIYNPNLIEGTKAGTSFDAVNVNNFYNEVMRNEKALRNVVGDEVYDNAKDIASMMKIMNRSSEDMLSKIRVKYRIPAGLSVESWISRLYSINRGIISPKYVATEAALLALRKRSATAMARILSDPKAGEAVRLLLEKGGRVSDKVHTKIQAVIFAALGAVMHSQRESNVEDQLAELRKNPQQFIETNTPTQ